MQKIKIPLSVEAFSRPKPVGRVSAKVFMRMGPGDQQKYLKSYPESSHRHLVKKAAAPKVKLNGKPNKKDINKDVPKFHKPKFGVLKPASKVKDNVETKRDADTTKARNTDIVRTEEEEHKKSNKNFINKESVRAIQKLNRVDMRKGGENIRSNRDDISDEVFEQWEDKPNLLKAGIDATRKFMEGDSASPKERLNSKQLIASVAKYALIGAGVAALALGAAPMGIVIAHLLHESWDTLSEADGSKDRKEKKAADREAKLREAEELNKSMRTPLDKYQEKMDRLTELLDEGLITRAAFNKASKEAKDELGDYESESSNTYIPTLDDDTRTVHNIINAVSDFLIHADIEDVKETSKAAFEGVASSGVSPVVIAAKRIMEKQGCQFKVIDGRVYGKCKKAKVRQAVTDVTSYLKSIGYTVFTEVDDGFFYRRFTKSDSNQVILIHNPKDDTIHINPSSANPSVDLKDLSL